MIFLQMLCAMYRLCLLSAAGASELHIVSHVPQAVEVYWLPGPEAVGRSSGSLAPAPSSLVISTYAGDGHRRSGWRRYISYKAL